MLSLNDTNRRLQELCFDLSQTNPALDLNKLKLLRGEIVCATSDKQQQSEVVSCVFCQALSLFQQVVFVAARDFHTTGDFTADFKRTTVGEGNSRCRFADFGGWAGSPFTRAEVRKANQKQ